MSNINGRTATDVAQENARIARDLRAMAFFIANPTAYVRVFSTTEVVRMTYIWKEKVKAQFLKRQKEKEEEAKKMAEMKEKEEDA